jgi:outer membrane protein assembly factor BamB
MQKLKNKIAAITIATLFILSIVASTSIIPTTKAHSPPWQIADHSYIAIAPNPIGVGQTLNILIWTAQPLPNAAITNNIRKANYVLTIAAPDGTNTTQTWGPIDNTGGEQFTTYVPNQVGNYTATFAFKGMTYPTLSQVTSIVPLLAATSTSINALAGDVYLPDQESATFTVQQEPLQTINYLLPTEYWARPIEGQNTNWYIIASNWLGPQSYQFGSAAQAGTGENVFQPDGSAPNSGHILWTKPMEFGGVIGGSNTAVPGATFYSGSSYQPRFYNSIIMNGYLYYKMPYGGWGTTTTVNGVVYGGAYVCVDLRTGQTIWTQTNPMVNPTWGQIYNQVDPNQSGGIPSGYLWQAWTLTPAATIAPANLYNPTGVTMSNVTWIAYEGTTGNWIFNITNVPQSWNQYGLDGTLLAEQTVMPAYGPSGELLRYVLDYNVSTQTGWLALWNSSAVINNLAAPSGPYRPEGRSIDGSVATPSTSTFYYNPYSWNVTINGNLNGLIINQSATYGVSPGGPTILACYPGDIMMGTSSGLGISVGPQYTPNPFTMWGINLNASRGPVGQILWAKNYTAPDLMAGNPNLGSYTERIGPVDSTTRVFTMQIGETFQWLGYSLDTGNLLWGPTTTAFNSGYQYFGGGLGIQQIAVGAYGNIYVQGYGGEIYCYNTATGNLLWQFGNGGEGNSTYDGINSPWGLLPTMISSIADGKVYVYSQQHGNGAQSPYYKGEMIWVLNATTGKQIWSITFQGPNSGGPGYPEGSVADGEYVNQNMYDNQIYAFGQGPSQTTVTAPNVGVTTATPITISGTVIDISAGTTQNEQAARFPNGVPVISDANQSAWMEYVYMQKPQPAHAIGVPVSIDVIDSNHNYRNIGTATSDSSGTFALSWTPDILGDYTVIATFAGSESYWKSSAETHFYASEAVTPAPTTEPVKSTADLYFVPAIAGIIVAIIVVGAVLALLMLRKRP